MAGVVPQPRSKPRSQLWTAVACLAVGAAFGMLLRPPGPPPLPPPPLYTPFSLPLPERHFAYELARMEVPTLVSKLRRLVSAAVPSSAALRPCHALCNGQQCRFSWVLHTSLWRCSRSTARTICTCS